LARRAAADAAFAADLREWWEHARTLRVDQQQVHNTISGGVQHGPVIQGRDFTGPISFGS
jgi:hypothetical protein